MGASDISYPALALGFLLLALPLAISLFLKVGLIKTTGLAILRMTVQLALVGVFLRYLFQLNNPAANLGWLAVMILFAAISVAGGTQLKRTRFVAPLFISLAVTTFVTLLYFNALVAAVPVLDARYLIAIGGMLLGNCLGGNIIGMNAFFQGIRRDEAGYRYSLALGSTGHEALVPYLRQGLQAALRPTIANMASIGLVFLPGMMTGQILGGSSPLVAVKYQLAIMLAVFTSVTVSVTATTLIAARSSFNRYGLLSPDIFRKAKA
ncbi:MAG: ABC transporter permease [Candidatus Geothermincolia bacterium]